MERKLQHEKQIKEQIGGDIHIQEGVKAELEHDIAMAEKELAEMKRKSQMLIGSSQDTATKTKKKANEKEDEDDVNVEYLSQLIQSEIEDVYRVFGENDNVLEAKSSLEILMEIESRFMNLTEVIQWI